MHSLGDPEFPDLSIPMWGGILDMQFNMSRTRINSPPLVEDV